MTHEILVKLNVGGVRYVTTTSTLTRRAPHSAFAEIIDALKHTPTSLAVDEQGYVLIDRNGSKFECVLDYLRDGCIESSTFSFREISRELDFFKIPWNRTFVVPTARIQYAYYTFLKQGKDFSIKWLRRNWKNIVKMLIESARRGNTSKTLTFKSLAFPKLICVTLHRHKDYTVNSAKILRRIADIINDATPITADINGCACHKEDCGGWMTLTLSFWSIIHPDSRCVELNRSLRKIEETLSNVLEPIRYDHCHIHGENLLAIRTF